MEMIDAHVHLAPRELLGQRDERFGLTVRPFGVKEGAGQQIRFLPPYFEDSCFSAGALLACMDSLGVEQAVIMQSLCHASNAAVAAAVAAHPERLRGAMVIEPGDEACLDEITHWHEAGLTVMKFETSAGLGYTHPNAYPALRFDEPVFARIFALAEKLALTVTIDPGRMGSRCYEPQILRKMALAFPGLHFVICHLGFPFPGLREDAERYALWREMCSLAALPNVWFDAAAMPDLFAGEGYPWAESLTFLREFLDQYPGKAVWGSDLPGTLTGATYSQMAEMYRRSALFTPEELASFFAGAARLAYRL